MTSTEFKCFGCKNEFKGFGAQKDGHDFCSDCKRDNRWPCDLCNKSDVNPRVVWRKEHVDPARRSCRMCKECVKEQFQTCSGCGCSDLPEGWSYTEDRSDDTLAQAPEGLVRTGWYCYDCTAMNS